MTTPSPDTRPVLIAYDGSDFAKAAIEDSARQLPPGREVVVLTVHEPMEAIPFLGLGGAAINQETVDAILTDIESGAEKAAAEGVRLAQDAGLSASALVEIGAPAWQRIIEVADERDAGLIVLGSRGHSGVGSVLLGSVATAVAHHSKRSVMIVHHLKL
jgi:nucleotide-binding universal stress UspA family protein